MLYLVTMPQCPTCAKRKQELKAAGTQYVEVDGNDPHYTVGGERLPVKVAMELLVQLAVQEWNVPTELELEEVQK